MKGVLMSMFRALSRRPHHATRGSLIRLLRVACALALPLPLLSAQHHYSAMGSNGAVELYTNLGSHHYAITTRKPIAQQYFNQGLRLTWAFNHAEAVRAFEEAERLDPTCAMCSWGVAYALGPNINAAMEPGAAAKAFKAIERAKARQRRASARERALIEALATRYAKSPGVSRASLDSAWAGAAGEVARRFPDDQEAQVLHADALMNLSPWNYWNGDGTARSGTSVILARVEGVMRTNPDHPGACHLYIHAVEAMHPARALPCAERLAALMPGAGHLVHMPGHIYVRVGRYLDAIKANEHALHADGMIMEGAGVARRGIYANGYYPHNAHFLSFAASMLGMSKSAINAARETVQRLGNDVSAMPAFVEGVTPVVPLTLVTFGKWAEILAQPEPDEKPSFKSGMTWYARGVAHAAQGNTGLALQAYDKLVRIAGSYTTGDLGTALQIATHALSGEIALRCGVAADAVEHFREAVRLEDGLTYNEPPTWYYPMRQSLGMALLASDDFLGAEKAYREDLARFPLNGWSLFGLAQSLMRQGREDDARAAWAEFAKAWKHADVTLKASRF